MKSLNLLIAVFCIAAAVAPAIASENRYAQRIIGHWQGARHNRAFYANGAFTFDPEPEGKALGTWKIVKDQLIIHAPRSGIEITERIVKLTHTEMIVSSDGKKYIYKRIEHY